MRSMVEGHLPGSSPAFTVKTTLPVPLHQPAAGPLPRWGRIYEVCKGRQKARQRFPRTSRGHKQGMSHFARCIQHLQLMPPWLPAARREPVGDDGWQSSHTGLMPCLLPAFQPRRGQLRIDLRHKAVEAFFA